MEEFDFEKDFKRFFETVKELRENQKRYFSSRTCVNLQRAIETEKRIDEELVRLEGFLGEQRTIF